MFVTGLQRPFATLSARLGRADHRWICPLMGVKRSCWLRARN